jgi:fructokinase
MSQLTIGLGEYLWDCFPDQRRPGGAPANVAYHADQLGLRGVVCTRVGDDADGAALRQHLADHGLAPEHVQVDRTHPTGTVSVAFSDGEPHYTIHEDVAWDYLEATAAWEALAQSAAAICFGTLAQRNAASRTTILTLLDHASHALRVYDVNLRPPFIAADWIDAALQRADVFKLNQQEIPTVGDLLELPTTNPAEFGRAALARYHGRVTCVTRGAAGCTLIARDEIVEVPSRPVAVADAVGAGDAFTAGLVYGLLQGWPLATVGRFANAIGGLVASRAGAMPAVRDEFDELRREIAS